MPVIDPAKVRRGHPVYIFGPHNAQAELRRNRKDWSIVVGANVKFGTQDEILAAAEHLRHHGFIPGGNMTTPNDDLKHAISVASQRADKWLQLCQKYHLAFDAAPEALELAIWQRGYNAGILDVTDAIGTVAKTTRGERVVH